jgi:hypothetical protein
MEAMPQHVHLVFSDPPAGVTDEEYHRWYDAHVREILEVPGFESVRRYAIAPVVAPDETGGYRFLAVYQLSCPPEEAVANLEAHGLGSADSYRDLKAEGGAGGGARADAGPLALPDWFGGVRFGSWNCTAAGETIALDG